MHALHEYLDRQLQKRLREHLIVVLYDPAGQLAPYLDELEPAGPGLGELPRVVVGDLPTHLARYEGSYFEIKLRVEPIVSLAKPEPLLIYVPAARDRQGSILLEIEEAGARYEPKFHQLARAVLKERYTDGVVDELLARGDLTWAEVVGFLEQGSAGEPASILRVIFPGRGGGSALVAAWLADPAHDAEIEAKQAKRELAKLLATRLGLEVDAAEELAKIRARCLRYVLLGEFRADLNCEPPSALAAVPAPRTREQLDGVREVAAKLRREHAGVYPDIADAVDRELRLGEAGIDPAALGSIDTFRFEERVLLGFAARLAADGRYEEALSIVRKRSRSFWADRDVQRQAQWVAGGRMAELGRLAAETRREIRKAPAAAERWVLAYGVEDGWCRVDLAQRALEGWVANVNLEPELETALERVRSAYEELLQELASRFTELYRKAHWAIPDVLQQSHIFSDLVEPGAGPVAYFVVDAMRFEMGVELGEQLKDSEELVLRPAVAALPTLTPVGMAALLPGASGSFDVVEHDGKLAARIDGTPMRDLQARMKYLESRVPGAVDLELGRVLQLTTKKLADAVEGAPVVLVRSREIDSLGEVGDNLVARQLMDTTVGNVARAVRKLATVGVERFVISADHGHLFTREREEAFRTDNPGGKTVELHRRCWIGRGGKSPTGTLRVAAADVGYESDLDFIFPTGIGVFRAGGGLAYHHGGISLQELIVPVLTLRVRQAETRTEAGVEVRLGGVPEILNNRTFGVTLELAGLFANEPRAVRPVLLAEGEQVGQAGMAIEAEFDPTTHCVMLRPGVVTNVALVLEREDCKKLRVVIQDPATDAVLAHSPDITVKLGI